MVAIVKMPNGLIMDLSAIGIPYTPGMYALRVGDDSMVGADIRAGDIVLLEKREAKTGEIVAALVNEAVTMKRLVFEENQVRLCAEHADHREFEVHGSEKQLLTG